MSKMRNQNISSGSIDLALHRKSSSRSCLVSTNVHRQGSRTSYTNINSSTRRLMSEQCSSTPLIWSTSVRKILEVTEPEIKSEQELHSGQAGGRHKAKSFPTVNYKSPSILEFLQPVLSSVSSDGSSSSWAKGRQYIEGKSDL